MGSGVIDAGQHVVVGVRGLGFNGIPADVEMVGQVYAVFTLRRGRRVPGCGSAVNNRLPRPWAGWPTAWCRSGSLASRPVTCRLLS